MSKMTTSLERGRQRNILREAPLIRPELYPGAELVQRHMIEVTQLAGVAVREAIDEFIAVPEGRTLSKRRKERRVQMLDPMAANIYREYFKTLPFRVVSVASEGGKEAEKLGYAMPTVLGEFGDGEYAISLANDVLEGTTAAAHNRPGAISVLSVSTYGGILPTPKEVKYLYKLFAPPEVAGKISIDAKDFADNFDIVRSTFGIPAREIHVVVMEREANSHIIEAARRFGVDLSLIDAGDLMPSFLALSSPEQNGQGVYMVAGRGGAEEGFIAASVAKTLGGHFEGRIWIPRKDNKELPEPGGRLLRVDDVVPGKKEHTMAIFTVITHDKWLDIPEIDVSEVDATGTTVVIDTEGFHRVPFERLLKAA